MKLVIRKTPITGLKKSYISPFLIKTRVKYKMERLLL